MVKKYSQGGKVQYDISKWIVDTEAELSSTPACSMGSTVYVIATGESWMMNSEGVLYSITNPDKDPVECDCVEEMTIWEDMPEA